MYVCKQSYLLLKEEYMRCWFNITGFIFVFLFSSCATAVYVPLEILRPSEKSFSDSLHVLAILANAPERTASQDEGVIIDAFNGRQRLQIKRDNLIPFFIKSMTNSLKQSSGGTLSVISLTDNRATGDIISQDKIRLVKDSLKADAVLSLDELSVVPSIRLTRIDEALFLGDLDIAVYAALRLYADDRETSDVFFCKDTISWQSYGETENRTLDRFPSFQDCLVDAASYSGQQVSRKFYPYIDNADRFYFVTPYPLMKEANSYWNRGNYDEASYLWEYVFENAGKMSRKAKAAANMALYEELNDRYMSALEWVNRALDIFSKYPEKYTNYIDYLSGYKRQLNVRIWEDKRIGNY